MRMCIVVGIIILLVIIIVPVVITFVQLLSTPDCGYIHKTLSDYTPDLAKNNNRAVWGRLSGFFWRGSGFHRHGGRRGNLALRWSRSPSLGWWESSFMSNDNPTMNGHENYDERASNETKQE